MEVPQYTKIAPNLQHWVKIDGTFISTELLVVETRLIPQNDHKIRFTIGIFIYMYCQTKGSDPKIPKWTKYPKLKTLISPGPLTLDCWVIILLVLGTFPVVSEEHISENVYSKSSLVII